MDMEKLTAENAALRAELEKMKGQFKTLKSIDYHQAFLGQLTKADGLELDIGDARRELGTLQRVYDNARAEWGRTRARWGVIVDNLNGQLTAARAEITSLKKEIKEGRQPATVSEQSTVLRL